MKCSECGDTGFYVGAGTLPPEPCRTCRIEANAINEFASISKPDQHPKTTVGCQLDFWSAFALIEREPEETDESLRKRVCDRLGINP